MMEQNLRYRIISTFPSRPCTNVAIICASALLSYDRWFDPRPITGSFSLSAQSLILQHMRTMLVQCEHYTHISITFSPRARGVCGGRGLTLKNQTILNTCNVIFPPKNWPPRGEFPWMGHQTCCLLKALQGRHSGCLIPRVSPPLWWKILTGALNSKFVYI